MDYNGNTKNGFINESSADEGTCHQARDMSWNPGNHMMEGRTDSCNLLSELDHGNAPTHTHTLANR